MIESEKQACIVCGKEFLPKTKRSKFCCDGCMKKFYNEKEKAKKPKKKEKICVMCGKVIDPKKSSLKYCSAECRKKKEEMDRERIRKRKIESMKKPRVCPVCGHKFLASVWNQEACHNPACQKELKRIKARGEYSPTKKRGGRIKYGSKSFYELPFERQWELMSLAQANDYARKQHKTYGELQNEYYQIKEGMHRCKRD